MPVQFQRYKPRRLCAAGAQAPLAGLDVAHGVGVRRVARRGALLVRFVVPARQGAWRALAVYTGAGELLLLADFCKRAGKP